MSDAVGQPRKRSEFAAFVILAFVIVPALAIAGVGALGLSIWLWNLAQGVVEAPPEAG